MVALQFLVLSVPVRIGVEQLSKQHRLLGDAAFCFPFCFLMTRFPLLPTTEILTDLIHLRFLPTEKPHAFVQRKEKEVKVYYPASLCFDTKKGQDYAHVLLTESLRLVAKALLVPMIRRLAMQHELPLQRVFIKDVTSRWGSCSSLKNINLSLWLLIFPSEYVEYILCHELAHLSEMNHSKAFWATADRLLGGSAGTAKQKDKAMQEYYHSFLKEQFEKAKQHFR